MTPTPAQPIPVGSKPAPAGTRVLRHAAWETRIILSNGEQLLLAIVLPLVALVGISLSSELTIRVPAGYGRVDVTFPGVVALAVISTSFTGQAISTAFDRRHGVLRFLATTPLGRSGLLLARVSAILAVQLVQILLLTLAAVTLGWRLAGHGWWLVLPAVLLGTTCFTALGLLVGGTLRAEAVLAVANLLWVLFAMAGVLVPAQGGVDRFGTLLPSGALAGVLRAAMLDQGFPPLDWMVLLAWTVAAVAAVRHFFRWDD